MLAGGCRTDSTTNDAAASVLTVAEACELLALKELTEAFGTWSTRVSHTVWCNRKNDASIAVTITPANRSASLEDSNLVERMARDRVTDLIHRKGWETRYRTVSVQFLP